MKFLGVINASEKKMDIVLQTPTTTDVIQGVVIDGVVLPLRMKRRQEYRPDAYPVCEEEHARSDAKVPRTGYQSAAHAFAFPSMLDERVTRL